MSRKTRVELIKQLQDLRKSHLIVYVTNTRQGMDVRMGLDAIPKIYQLLTAFPKPEKKTDKPLPIDLFIHSNGGEGTVSWRMVTLIREYTDQFRVIIPHRAFSAATLAALGADEIAMHPMGMLGPTDASVTSPFNPQNPLNPKELLGINVEDVTAYLSLIKEDAGIQHEDELVMAFNKLVDTVHPLALGTVKRTLSQSRMMARKLLALHMDTKSEAHKIDEIVDNLTSKLFFHGHPINRVEARDEIGLAKVKNLSDEEEKLVWKLYLEYEKEMKLDTAFNIITDFGKKVPTVAVGATEISQPDILNTVIIENESLEHRYEFEYELVGQKAKNGVTQIQMVTRREEWVT